MPRPLRRQTHDGVPYTRLPAIDEAIDVALQQDETTLIGRGALDRKAGAYLPSECLVHLIREAKRVNDRRRLNALVRLLMVRCVANLRATVSGGLPAAEQLREDILSQLLELIAGDGIAKDQPKLDFFEVRFDGAFQKLRIDAVNATLRRARVEGAGEDLEGIDVAEAPNDDLAVDAEKIADHLHLLTTNERTAIGLRYLKGLVEHSSDPDRPSIAKLMKVSDRTVRNYLRSAKEKLRAALEATS